jgi:hypothetical protein
VLFLTSNCADAASAGAIGDPMELEHNTPVFSTMKHATDIPSIGEGRQSRANAGPIEKACGLPVDLVLSDAMRDMVDDRIDLALADHSLGLVLEGGGNLVGVLFRVVKSQAADREIDAFMTCSRPG